MQSLVLQIFGLHGWEWIIIVFIILLLFGSKKVPELARSLGRAVSEFQRGKAEFERQIMEISTLPSPSPTPSVPPKIESTQKIQEAKAQEANEGEKLVKVARELGIATEGKTSEQLKEEIKKALEAA
ncbi:MAG: twin-arginine translocase TatA/TatE family subunit [Nitrososphaerales archaeon]|nr:twin-arginine translocase TatA/TatE family subunit [Nitrososphaerales archaeon]